MTNTHARVKTHTPTARHGRGTLRNAALVCLLLGWVAFWLVATLQPCCKLAVASAHSVATETVSQSVSLDHHGNAGHHAPDSSGSCHDIAAAAGAALTAAMPPLAGEPSAQAYAACATYTGYAARRAVHTTAFSALPPPRTPPFHLRTSRILI